MNVSIFKSFFVPRYADFFSCSPQLRVKGICTQGFLSFKTFQIYVDTNTERRYFYHYINNHKKCRGHYCCNRTEKEVKNLKLHYYSFVLGVKFGIQRSKILEKIWMSMLKLLFFSQNQNTHLDAVVWLNLRVFSILSNFCWNLENWIPWKFCFDPHLDLHSRCKTNGLKYFWIKKTMCFDCIEFDMTNLSIDFDF